MKLFTVALVLGALVVSGEADGGGQTWAQLCNGKVKNIESLQQLDQLYSNAFQDILEHNCIKKRVDTQDIAKVAEYNKKGLLCATKTGDAMINMGHDLTRNMPSIVLSFAKRLARDVNGHCKANILDHIEELDNAFKSKPALLGPIDKLEKAGALLLLDDKLGLEELQQADVVQVVGQLFYNVARARHYAWYKEFKMSPKSKKLLFDLQTQCWGNFAHLMNPLFHTAVVTAQMEYNSPGLKALNSNRLVRKWLSVFLLCKSMQNFQTFEGDLELYKKNRAQLSEENLFKMTQPAEWLGKDDIKHNPAVVVATKEAQAASANIYEVLVGDKLNMLDRIHHSGEKFWNAFWRHVDSKLNESS